MKSFYFFFLLFCSWKVFQRPTPQGGQAQGGVVKKGGSTPLQQVRTCGIAGQIVAETPQGGATTAAQGRDAAKAGAVNVCWLHPLWTAPYPLTPNPLYA